MSEGAYDSRPDTYEHIANVGRKLDDVVRRLLQRREDHDRSKLVSPEVEVFDEVTPKLKATTYGSAEYKGYLAQMGDGLAHHYAENSHHPEHYADGIAGMSLLDLIEMLCDWKAATERHDDGDIRRSLVLNAERFGISEQLVRVLANTVDEMEWGFLMPAGAGLDLAELRAANVSRKARWHGDDDGWTLADWSNAMCGEAGETANVVKKIRRTESRLWDAQKYPGDGATSTLAEMPAGEAREALTAALANECADVLCYLDLLAEKAGIDLAAAVIEKFNRVSEAQGFPERIGLAASRVASREDEGEAP